MGEVTSAIDEGFLRLVCLTAVNENSYKASYTAGANEPTSDLRAMNGGIGAAYNRDHGYSET